MNKQKVINIAVIAHVDAGKSTLVDAFLKQSGLFRTNEAVVEQVMDSDDLERERGITIYAKNCSIQYKDYKINIVDTPGHADFGSEVERVIKTVDTVILLVDSVEGPMPQTRFVLQKSLEIGLRPILLINKIDKRDQRADEVIDMVFDLFVELGATNEQLDFPILYGIAKDGIVQYELEDEGSTIEPLLETIINHVEPYPDYSDLPLQMQVSTLAYDDYIGRLGIGRIYKGTIKENESVVVVKSDGSQVEGKVVQVYTYDGLKRTRVNEAYAGDIVVMAGIPHISIGDTICSPDHIEPLEPIHIEEPTLSMNFLVNTSPFAGQSGKYVTSRHLRARLFKELEVNVGLKIEEIEGIEGFKVSGRGELHLSILIENMRREGYELAISKPEVIMKTIDGVKHEPIETVIIHVPEKYSSTIITKLSLRKGMMVSMDIENQYVKLIFRVPTRGLIGYRGEFITDTHGEGTIVQHFYGYEPFKGEIPERENGALIAKESGEAMTYALFHLESRGELFISPGTQVYEGMVVGEHNRSNDLTVNVCRNKKMTNMRASSADESMRLTKPREFTLEEALEYINDDELVEVTPDAIRLRKKYLTEVERKRATKQKQLVTSDNLDQ